MFIGPKVYKPVEMVPTKSTSETPEISEAQKAFQVGKEKLFNR